MFPLRFLWAFHPVFVTWLVVAFGDQVTKILHNSLFTFFTEQCKTGKNRTHGKGNIATYFWYFGSFDVKTNLQKYEMSRAIYKFEVWNASRAIITRSLYIFYPLLHWKAVYITDNLCTKNRNSSFLKPKIHGLYKRAVTNQERVIVVRVW